MENGYSQLLKGGIEIRYSAHYYILEKVWKICGILQI